jgi:peptide/nickel transport system permease protein
MTSYILRRLIQTVVVIGLLSFFCFYIMTLMPGDPVDLLIASNPKITSEDVERLRQYYGLDQPAHKRYWHWVSTIAQGDLGYSRTYRVPVSEIIVPKLLNTFYLSVSALIFSLLIAIPLGVLAALKAGTKIDYTISSVAFFGISMPSFWLGILLIIVFAVQLGWLPAGGTFTVGFEPANFWEAFWDRAKYMILPALPLAFVEIGVFLRFTRSSMLEAMRNDYIRTAKAKGLSYSRVVWRHGFRNALLPLITILALNFAFVFSGATVTETIFAYQGVGKLVYDSIIANDFNVAMVSFMISVSMVLIFNLLADILYGFADPRISYK